VRERLVEENQDIAGARIGADARDRGMVSQPALERARGSGVSIERVEMKPDTPPHLRVYDADVLVEYVSCDSCHVRRSGSSTLAARDHTPSV
jgi:hypothetical protein